MSTNTIPRRRGMWIELSLCLLLSIRMRPEGIEVAEIVFFRSILGTQLIEIIIRHQFAIGSLP